MIGRKFCTKHERRSHDRLKPTLLCEVRCNIKITVVVQVYKAETFSFPLQCLMKSIFFLYIFIDVQPFISVVRQWHWQLQLTNNVYNAILKTEISLSVSSSSRYSLLPNPKITKHRFYKNITVTV